MLVITAPNLPNLSNLHEDINKKEYLNIFLAGGITNCVEWQRGVINLIKELKFENSLDNVIIYNPRRADFNISKENIAYEVKKQIEWEFERLEECDIFTMYFCNSVSNQPICLYELGRNLLRMQQKFDDWSKRIIITIEEGYSRADDVIIQTRLATGLNDLVQMGDIKSHTARIIKSCFVLKDKRESGVEDEKNR